MASRACIVREAARASRQLGWPLMVGNGFLSREVMNLAEPGQQLILPLQGGMGLTGGVAAGYTLGRPDTGVVVLEGDGNHAMGWGSAQFIGDQSARVLHLVSCNGVYLSTGGQPVPRPLPLDQVAAAVTVLGYRHGLQARTDDELSAIVDRAATLAMPCLLYVAEDPGQQAPDRKDYPSAAYAAHLATYGAATNKEES